MNNTDILIDYINKIIEESVIHGGDAGGSYNTNEEDLVSIMTEFGKWYGLKNYVIIDKDGIPQFGKVIKDIPKIKI